MKNLGKMKLSKKIYNESLKETFEIYKEILGNTKKAIKVFNEDFMINWEEQK